MQRETRFETRKASVWSVRLAYIVVLALATLTPFSLDMDPSAVLERIIRALNATFSPRDAVDAARNVTLFAGWGALWIASTNESEHLNWAIVTATITGAALSVSLEFLQLFSASRHASILDIITNSSGAFLGAAAIVSLTAAARHYSGQRSFLGIPAFVFALSYLSTTFLEAFGTFNRQTMLPAASGGPLSRFAVVLDALRLNTVVDMTLLDFLLFLPLGVLGVAALVESGWSYGRAAMAASSAGFIAAGAGEVAHGFSGQPIILGSVLASTLGSAAGAWAAQLWLPSLSRELRGRKRLRVFLAAYASVIAVWAWQPFLPELDSSAIAAQLSLHRLIPLQAHGPRVDFGSVVDVAQSFFLFLPLGALLGVWPLRLRGPLSVFCPALYLALLTEVGQIFIAGRYFDVTDILVASAGAAIGWTVAFKAGYRPYGEIIPKTARLDHRA